jgi:hypothetical protein
VPRRRRKLSTTILFTVLFFAGAALTAAAGNEVATIVTPSSPPSAAPATYEQDTTTTDVTATDTNGADTTTETTTTEPADTTTTAAATTTETTTESADTTTAPSDPGQTDPAGGDGGAGTVTQPAGESPQPPTPTMPSDESGPATSPAGNAPQATAEPVPVLAPAAAPASTRKKKAKRAKPAYSSQRKAPKPREIEHEATPGVEPGDVHWIDQPLPDPTPPSMRLSVEFARELRAVSSSKGLDWAFLLAVLRSERLGGSGQVTSSVLHREAAALGPLHTGVGDRKAALAYRHDRAFAQRVLVLERYYKAIGVKSLVAGLAASRDRLAAKVLSDPRIDIYPGGREDISSGRVDVRVVAMIAYLAESFGDVRVSCLITGHRLYARPGVISAHIYGRAVDIGALDDVSIYGHQLQRGSVTERATRQILLLPAEMMPKQVISLLGLGGPSFPLADHADHIHIGY